MPAKLKYAPPMEARSPAMVLGRTASGFEFALLNQTLRVCDLPVPLRAATVENGRGCPRGRKVLLCKCACGGAVS